VTKLLQLYAASLCKVAAITNVERLLRVSCYLKLSGY